MAIIATSQSDIDPDVYDMVIDQLGPRLWGSDGFRGHFAGVSGPAVYQLHNAMLRTPGATK